MTRFLRQSLQSVLQKTQLASDPGTNREPFSWVDHSGEPTKQNRKRGGARNNGENLLHSSRNLCKTRLPNCVRGKQHMQLGESALISKPRFQAPLAPLLPALNYLEELQTPFASCMASELAAHAMELDLARDLLCKYCLPAPAA